MLPPGSSGASAAITGSPLLIGVPAAGVVTGAGGGVAAASSGPAPLPAAVSSTIATAPGSSKAAACAAVLQTERISMPHNGGEIEVKATFTAPACAPMVVSNWVHAAGTPTAGVYRFRVEPNRTARVRQTVLLFGDQRFTVGQAGRTGPNIAASPGKLEFNLKRKQSRKMAVVAWSEGSHPELTFRKVGKCDWLEVHRAPAKKTLKGTERFEVAVNASQLPPGRHEATLQIDAPEAANSPIEIPVVLNVSRK